MTNGPQSIRSAAWRRAPLAPKARGCFPMFDSDLRYRGIVGRLRDLPWGRGRVVPGGSEEASLMIMIEMR